MVFSDYIWHHTQQFLCISAVLSLDIARYPLVFVHMALRFGTFFIASLIVFFILWTMTSDSIEAYILIVLGQVI